jgi:hypothetical protein
MSVGSGGSVGTPSAFVKLLKTFLGGNQVGSAGTDYDYSIGDFNISEAADKLAIALTKILNNNEAWKGKQSDQTLQDLIKLQADNKLSIGQSSLTNPANVIIRNGLSQPVAEFEASDGSATLGGVNRRVKLSETGLTAQRTYTYPDFNDRLVGSTELPDIEHVVNDWTQYKYGAYTLTTANGGDGVFNNYLTSIGIHSIPVGTNSGIESRFTTAGASGDQGGIRTNGVITRADNNPRLTFSTQPISTSTMVVSIGFVSTLGAFPTGTDPLNALHGVGFRCSSAETNCRFMYNDGVGPTNHDDYSPTTTTTSQTNQFFELYTDDRGVTWHLVVNGVDNVKSSQLPGTTTSLAMVAYCEATSAAARAFDINHLQIRMETQQL